MAPPRVTHPRDDEPIRLVKVASGYRYRVTLDVAPPGTPRRQITRTFPNITTARTFVVETRAGISTGTYVAPDKETVSELCERWLRSRHDVRAVTLEGYRSYLSPVLRHLGGRRVQTLTSRDADELVQWLSAEGGNRGQALAPRSVKASMTALGSALDVAVGEGTVSRNVAKLARKPRVRAKSGTDLEHWKPANLRKFVEHADADRYAALWRLTACGLTRADVMGLRWSDVDLDSGVVTIAQGRVQLDKGSTVDDPKSTNRRRALPVETMWPGTVAALRSFKAAQAADRLRAGGAYTDTGLVAVDDIGRPLAPQHYSDMFKALSTDAGLPTITLHSVRHSLAFWLHSVGVSPADAAALLGHTVQVHLSTYLPHSGSSGIAAAAAAVGKSAKKGGAIR